MSCEPDRLQTHTSLLILFNLFLGLKQNKTLFIMRIDLYTNSDRAREAQAIYFAGQEKLFWKWVSSGSVVIALGILIILSYMAPGFLYSTTGVIEYENSDFIWVHIFAPLFSIKGIIIFIIIWFVLCLLGRLSSHLVAIYQGVLMGTIATVLTGGLVGFLFGIFGNEWALTNTSIVLGSIAGVITLVLGVMGAFLPDA